MGGPQLCWWPDSDPLSAAAQRPIAALPHRGGASDSGRSLWRTRLCGQFPDLQGNCREILRFLTSHHRRADPKGEAAAQCEFDGDGPRYLITLNATPGGARAANPDIILARIPLAALYESEGRHEARNRGDFSRCA